MSKRDSSELTRTFLFALSWQWDAQDWAQTVGIIRKLLAEVVGRGTGLGSGSVCLCIENLNYLTTWVGRDVRGGGLILPLLFCSPNFLWTVAFTLFCP